MMKPTPNLEQIRKWPEIIRILRFQKNITIWINRSARRAKKSYQYETYLNKIFQSILFNCIFQNRDNSNLSFDHWKRNVVWKENQL
jgi:hypothetical protein